MRNETLLWKTAAHGKTRDSSGRSTNASVVTVKVYLLATIFKFPDCLRDGMMNLFLHDESPTRGVLQLCHTRRNNETPQEFIAKN